MPEHRTRTAEVSPIDDEPAGTNPAQNGKAERFHRSHHTGLATAIIVSRIQLSG